MHWPIYTEIAAHHGIKAASPSRWRASAAQGSGEHFDLKEMLRRSWAIYDAADRKNLEKALGSAQVADVAVGG